MELQLNRMDATPRQPGEPTPSSLRISVVMPSYNAARFLPEALASVAAQTHPANEVIVVDDGSTDNTLAQLQNHPNVRVISQANAGPAAARNTGVAHASGDLIAFLDADCIYYPERLARHHALHQADTTLAFSVSELEERFEGGLEAPWWSATRLTSAEGRYRISLPGMMIRRHDFLALSGFNPNLRTGEDTEFIARLCDLGYRKGHIAEVLGATRIHGDNLSANRDSIARDMPKAIHAALRARRGKG
jgi:glycosyltransferase involved in cell wall biosynthesis